MRIYLLIILVVAFLCPVILIGQTYSLPRVADDLLTEETHVLKQSEQIHFEVIDKGNALEHVRQVYTILNPRGTDYARIKIFYDDLVSIQKLSAILYDANGKKVETYSKRDFDDYKAYDGISFLTDSRVKYLDMSQTVYPYTIEVKYTRERDGLFIYPTWDPVDDEFVAVKHSTFKVSLPEGLDIDYKMHLFDVEPTKTKDSDKTIYEWSINDFQAVEYETMGPQDQTPYVQIVPNEFELEDYEGSIQSWKEFGQFINSMNANRDVLPDNVVAEMKELTKGMTDQKEIVETIYKHMQSNTRYLSVQLGIGGWQTISAADVNNDKYGDCKALSNYTQSLLKAVGIPSCYTLINAGKRITDIDPDFPSQQFNHAILSVPLQNDTIWLECTNQLNPANYMGYFTDNRYALMVTPDGGKLVRTPTYPIEENHITKKSTISINLNGDAVSHTQYNLGGYRQAYYRYLINTVNDKTELEQKIHKIVYVAGSKLNDYTITKSDTTPFSIQMKVDLEIQKFASKTGKRYIFTPSLHPVQKKVPPVYESRQFEVINQRGYVNIDTTIVEIPDGFVVENYQTEPNKITSEFGQFFVQIQKQTDNRLCYISELKMNAFNKPPETYEAYRQFIKDINKAGKMQVVLVKE